MTEASRFPLYEMLVGGRSSFMTLPEAAGSLLRMLAMVGERIIEETGEVRLMKRSDREQIEKGIAMVAVPTGRFPLYELFVEGESQLLSLEDAARALKDSLVNIEWGNFVIESFGVQRPLSPGDRSIIGNAADLYSHSS